MKTSFLIIIAAINREDELICELIERIISELFLAMRSPRTSLIRRNVANLSQRFYAHFSKFAIKSGLRKVIRRFAFQIALYENLYRLRSTTLVLAFQFCWNLRDKWHGNYWRMLKEVKPKYLNFVSAPRYLLRDDEFQFYFINRKPLTWKITKMLLIIYSKQTFGFVRRQSFFVYG